MGRLHGGEHGHKIIRRQTLHKGYPICFFISIDENLGARGRLLRRALGKEKKGFLNSNA